MTFSRIAEYTWFISISEMQTIVILFGNVKIDRPENLSNSTDIMFFAKDNMHYIKVLALLATLFVKPSLGKSQLWSNKDFTISFNKKYI